MKHINEHNWKQELSMLKALRIHTKHTIEKQQALCATGTAAEENSRAMFVLNLQNKIKELDKAIETIENVFVHKQCWIA